MSDKAFGRIIAIIMIIGIIFTIGLVCYTANLRESCSIVSYVANGR